MRLKGLERCAIAIGLLIGVTSMSVPPRDDERADVCQGVQGTFAEIERQIEASRAELHRLNAERAAATGAAEKRAADQRLAAKRTEVGDLVFQQDCVRTDFEPVRGPASGSNWITLNTWYATNRRPGPTQSGVASYSGEREANRIRFGRVTVSIPTLRQPGELNLPLNLWLFELPADPDKHFIIKAVTPLSPDAAKTEMRNRVAQLGRKSVLVFVHGYNVSFRDAALRTAQLAHDLNFPGLPVFFSWPSAGTTGGYPRDEEMSELSIDAFNKLLDSVADLQASEVFIVAHSMGNRVVTRALAARLAAGRPVPPNIKGLLLAAPDINADIFREQIAPRLAALSGMSKTIYASSNDAALRASRALHDFPRVGLTAPSVQTFSGWETVDASSVAPIRRAWGHSYVVDSPRVISDIQAILYQRRSARQRGLPTRGSPPRTWWAL